MAMFFRMSENRRQIGRRAILSPVGKRRLVMDIFSADLRSEWVHRYGFHLDWRQKQALRRLDVQCSEDDVSLLGDKRIRARLRILKRLPLRCR